MKKTYIQPTVKVRMTESAEHFMAGSLAGVAITGLDNDPLEEAPATETVDLWSETN